MEATISHYKMCKEKKVFNLTTKQLSSSIITVLILRAIACKCIFTYCSHDGDVLSVTVIDIGNRLGHQI